MKRRAPAPRCRLQLDKRSEVSHPRHAAGPHLAHLVPGAHGAPGIVLQLLQTERDPSRALVNAQHLDRDLIAGGDDFAFGPQGNGGLFRLFGDANGDQRVDVADLGLFAGTFLKQQGDPGFLAAFDADADGRVDVTDLGQFAARFLTTLP